MIPTQDSVWFVLLFDWPNVTVGPTTRLTAKPILVEPYTPSGTFLMLFRHG